MKGYAKRYLIYGDVKNNLSRIQYRVKIHLIIKVRHLEKVLNSIEGTMVYTVAILSFKVFQNMKHNDSGQRRRGVGVVMAEGRRKD